MNIKRENSPDFHLKVISSSSCHSKPMEVKYVKKLIVTFYLTILRNKVQNSYNLAIANYKV